MSAREEERRRNWKPLKGAVLLSARRYRRDIFRAEAEEGGLEKATEKRREESQHVGQRDMNERSYEWMAGSQSVGIRKRAGAGTSTGGLSVKVREKMGWVYCRLKHGGLTLGLFDFNSGVPALMHLWQIEEHTKSTLTKPVGKLAWSLHHSRFITWPAPPP